MDGPIGLRTNQLHLRLRPCSVVVDLDVETVKICEKHGRKIINTTWSRAQMTT